MRVKWLRAALKKLENEAEYIAQDNPAAAYKMVASISRAIDRLVKYPALGRPGRVSGVRELVIPGTPYIVPYRVRDDSVEVLRVFHAARKMAQELRG